MSATNRTVMSQAEALDWVAKLFEETPGRLTPETRRADIIAWDSLGVLTLMASLDSDFDIVLSDDDIQEIKTVGHILDVLRKNGALA